MQTQASTASPSAHRTGRLPRLLRRLITGLIAAYTLSTLLIVIFLIVDTSDIAWIEFIRTIMLFALLPVPLVLILALALRRWRLGLLLIPVLIASGGYYLPYLTPKSSTATPGSNPLTVASYNILALGDPASLAAIAAVVRESGADVVGLQEINESAALGLGDLLADDYPYYVLHYHDYWHARGQGLFSRYPITERAYWSYKKDMREHTHGQMRVVIDFHGAPVVIYNLHGWPPFEWRGGLDFLILPADDVAHQESVRRGLERTLIEIGPTVLLGDFNMSDQFHEYAAITQHYSDTFREVGQGLGFTYPAHGFGPLPPLIRLDYVFHSEHFRGVDMVVLPDAGPSDHFPVRATLELID